MIHGTQENTIFTITWLQTVFMDGFGKEIYGQQKGNNETGELYPTNLRIQIARQVLLYG